MSNIEKIYPTEEELSLICSQVRCSAENCFAVFKSTSNLNMHLIRHHKMKGEELRRKDVVRQFYCPAQLCIYNKDSKKCFKKLKYLKQHFLKVHAARNFVCNKCGKRFATDSFKKLHSKTCGSSFNCTCGFAYNSVEALLTHCRRKGHVSLRSSSVSCGKINFTKEKSDKIENNFKKTERLICPKLSSDMSYPVHHIAAIALSELSSPCVKPKFIDKGIQTEFSESYLWKDLRKNGSASKFQRKQNSSQQTQTTGKYKNLKINTETQTNSEYLKSKLKSPVKISFSKKRKKSMETQTKELLNSVVGNNVKNYVPVGLLHQSPKSAIKNVPKLLNSGSSEETLFQDISPDFLKDGSSLNNADNYTELTDLNSNGGKSFINGGEMADKSIKTKQDLFSATAELNICNKEFETDLNELNMSCKRLANESENMYLMESGSYNVFDINRLCNIETQTEIDNFLTGCNDDTSFTLCFTTETQTVDFDPLLYSNMCTQTSDEVNELFNFNFVDIETQTAWPDF